MICGAILLRSFWPRFAAFISAWLPAVLQRIAFGSHVGCLLLATLGPIYCPALLASAVIIVHIVFVCCQLRTAYGMWACWRGTKAHASKDWRAEWEQGKEKLEKERKGQYVMDIELVQHVIIVPAYKEEVHTLEETLDVLTSHPLADSTYRVCLAMEEREVGAAAKAESLIKRYRAQGAFLDIDFSMHPGDIVGESAGKSSNVAWATRYMAGRIPASLHTRQVITVMDSDTCFASSFFLSVSTKYALAPPARRQRMMFVPPILFDRNSPDVPVFVRVADIFWASAGIGGIYPGSTVRIPTSAYAVSMELAKYVNFWDAGPEAIGEDMHFYCKALFETKGTLHVETVYSPASQCNVVGRTGAGPLSTYWNNCTARWTQAVRHMWGSLDSGYVWYRILTGSFGPSDLGRGKDHKEEELQDALSIQAPSANKVWLLPRISTPEGREPPSYRDSIELTSRYMRDDEAEESDTLVSPASLKDSGDTDDSTSKGEPRWRWFPFVVLVARLYEAHFMVAHLFLLMAVLTIYPTVLYGDGSFVITDPYERQRTWTETLSAFTNDPMARTLHVPTGAPAPALSFRAAWADPIWIMPDLVLAALRVARTLGAIGIIATVCVCVMHDLYHRIGATQRWRDSNKALAAWKADTIRARREDPEAAVALTKIPSRYLGIRPARTCVRAWPLAAFDFLAIPAGIAFGIAPLLWAQLNHVVTNRLTYTVSAKPGAYVALPTWEGGMVNIALERRQPSTDRRSVDGYRFSLEGQRRSLDTRSRPLTTVLPTHAYES